MKRVKKLTLAFLMVPMLALASLSTGCGDDNFATVAEAIDANDTLDVFNQLIDVSSFDDTLNGPGPFTVFATTDEAFATLPAGTIDDLLQVDPGKIAVLLSDFVVGDRLSFNDLIDIADTTGVVNTLGGAILVVDFDGTDVFINGDAIVESDIEADNGIVHTVNGTLDNI